MCSSVFIILCSVVALIVASYLWSQRRPQNCPPGPWGLPIIGNLLQIGKTPFKTFLDWKSKYGPVVFVYFGSLGTVAISDYKLVKEALTQNVFAGRPDLQPFRDRSYGKRRGVLFGDGNDWAEQRRFMIKQLKELGFGNRSAMESVIHKEIEFLLEDLNETSGHAICMKHTFNQTVINVIWKLVSDERFLKDDPGLVRVLNIINTNISEKNGLADVAMFVPWMTKYFPVLSGYENMMKDLPDLLGFISNHLKHHIKTHQDLQPRGFLDIYIDEIKKTTDPASSFYGENGYKSMHTVLLDLFSAGGESSSTTLSWFCLYLALNPIIQEKVYGEIRDNIGCSRLATSSDITFLPYLEATTLEVFRRSTIVPLAIFHNTLADTTIGGYFIPKDTMIFPNIYACHFDKEYWGDPENFRPERFLDPTEKTIIKHEPFMPFSHGKRVCPGEHLSYQEIFLIITAIIQNFKISTDPENPNPSIEPDVSIIQIPKPHKLVFTKRL